ncbi:MAG: TonB-dependent receptor [Gemmatimonadetes bacterium]|nr:TonB-dependent receptor [Gemmatimonadota bacterium]
MFLRSLLALALAPLSVLTAQAGTGELRARVVAGGDSTPIRSARVDVLRAGTLAPVARTTTADDGTLRLRVAAGRYRVRLVAIGFAPREVPGVDVRDGAATDLGTIGLAVRAADLARVTVSGEADLVTLAPDRNQYVVKDMPSVRGGNVLDVLRNVPSVDVDIDNVVSLRGNSGVTIQINGRPSPLKAQQLGEYLASLPADIVERVEVIPNPSANDDPDGSAGIINIVLKREPDAGTSGGVTVSGATTGNFTAGGSVGVQRGKWTAFGSLSGYRTAWLRTDIINRTNLQVAPSTYLAEHAQQDTRQYGATMTARLGYQPTAHDELSFDGLFTSRVEFEVDSNVYRNLDAAHAFASANDRVTTNNNHRFNLDLNTGWRHAFEEKGHKLSVEARLYRATEQGPLDIKGHTLAPDFSRTGFSAVENEYGLEAPAETNVRLDWVKPLASWLRLDAGYKWLLQGWETRFDTEVQNLGTGAFGPDSNRISNFEATQRTHSVYGVLNAQAGHWLLQAGLRLEDAATSFHLRTHDSSYDNQYQSHFVSALVAYNLTDADQLKVSMSERIRRPDPGFQVDPSLTYTDPLNVSRGNPFLRPEYTRAYELGYQHQSGTITVQLSPFFRRTTGAIRAIRTIDTLGVATRTFANVATTDAYGVDVTVGRSVGSVTGFVGASGFRQVSDAANLGAGLSADAFVWTARANIAWRVSRTLDVQGLVTYRAPQTVEQGTQGAQLRPSFAIRQKLMDDRLALTLRIVDPFNSATEISTTIDPRFIQESNRLRVIRGLLLSANWTFGRQRKQHEQLPDDPG